MRVHFNAEYGQHLPEDLCLSIANAPTAWEIVPVEGTTFEVLPHIDSDLIAEVSRWLCCALLGCLSVGLRQERGLEMERVPLAQRACKGY